MIWVLNTWKHSIPAFPCTFVLSLSHLARLGSVGFPLRTPHVLREASRWVYIMTGRYLWASWVCVCRSVSVHCEASEWSPWSPCTKKGKTCGFKRGTETRVREITQHPSAKGNLCPPTSETRKCTVPRKKCQKGERGTIVLEKCPYLNLHNLMQFLLYFLGHIQYGHSCLNHQMRSNQIIC